MYYSQRSGGFVHYWNVAETLRVGPKAWFRRASQSFLLTIGWTYHMWRA